MPHGTRRVGGVEVVALCDGVVLASRPTRASFPGGRPEVWAEARRRFPEVFGPEDRWRLHVHCLLLRSRGRTVLVDTGIGPESAPAFAWSATRGRLPEELAAAGADPREVDDVVITHVHDDHLGWNLVEGAREPLFPNARYLVHRADVDLLREAAGEEGQAVFEATLAPLEAAGVLHLTGDRLELTAELAIVHAPGHTPGHQVVLVDSDGERAIVSADLVNHPAQLLQPGLNGTSDHDPERAAATRAELLGRIDREGRLVVPAHLPEPFGRLVPDGARRLWRPA